MAIPGTALFPLGATPITPAARDHLATARVAPAALLARHAAGLSQAGSWGDWGHLCPADRAENALSLRAGCRLLSDYPVAGERVWIITEAARSRTTILLASEY